MIFRLAAVTALASTVAACGSGPELNPVQARQVATAALEPCDGAVNVLNIAMGHGTPVGVVRMARAVQDRCGTATSALISARLPARVFESCQYASLAASSLGEAAEAAANSASPSAVVQLEDATTKAAGARQQCDAAIA